MTSTKNLRSCIVCAICNTYIATAKINAPESGVIAAFAIASTDHIRKCHKNLPIQQMLFIRGMRAMS